MNIIANKSYAADKITNYTDITQLNYDYCTKLVNSPYADTMPQGKGSVCYF